MNVNNFLSSLSELSSYLLYKIKHFKGGSIKDFQAHWRNVTGDFETLQTVAGMPVLSPLVTLDAENNNITSFSSSEVPIIEKEISKLLDKGVIKITSHEKDEFLSPIFLLPKDYGSFRMILNLKRLNESMPYIHFKMDTFDKVLKLIRPNCFMCTVDIKDAYYSVPISEFHQKYLKFQFQDKLYKFVCLPNGLCSGPRKFTKLLKPVLAVLRQQGYIVSAYIDDIIIMDDSYEDCIRATIETVKLLDYLGFTIHPVKSNFVPARSITYLGFLINSEAMKVTLPFSKVEKIKEMCSSLYHSQYVSIRYLASVIGTIVSSFPAVKFGPLHYRSLECDKIEALKFSKGNFDSYVYISKAACDEAKWWMDNISLSFKEIYIDNPEVVIATDASSTGWGAVYNNTTTRGIWQLHEKSYHINVLELKAILFGLISLIKVQNTHIKILTDNMNAVHSIRNMGSCRSLACNDLVKRIWSWAIQNNNWLSISYIPGVENSVADAESRQYELRTEWQLNPSIFRFIVRKLNIKLDIDLFASRVNYQLKPFVSFWPDPEAFAVDSFTLDWSSWKFYAFPPFAIIPRVLQKVSSDKAIGLLIVPDWPYSSWFSQYNRLLISECIIIPSSNHLLHLPNMPGTQHPLQKSLKLRAGIVSGMKGCPKIFLLKPKI